MKPFSTPVLSKRTYRELKLLKHIQHENVRYFHSSALNSPYVSRYIKPKQRFPRFKIYSDNQSERCFHLSARRHVCTRPADRRRNADDIRRYFVTELLGTDLHRLLTSRPLEKQFVQYFLYQILVSDPVHLRQCKTAHPPATTLIERSQIRALRGSRPSRPCMWLTPISFHAAADTTLCAPVINPRNPATSWSTRIVISRFVTSVLPGFKTLK